MRAPNFWNSKSASAQFAGAALSPFAWGYGAVGRYRAAHATPYHSACKVICVGNLTSGGTGKTPIVATLAALLRERGVRSCVLSRGYGGTTRGPKFVDPRSDRVREVGDEALLLARTETVIVSVDRAAGARMAESGGTGVILMDDGYQNFSLAKDLSFLVVDSEVAFGNGHVLPAGPLRERVADGIKRADVVVIVGKQDVDVRRFDAPLLRAKLSPIGGNAIRGRRLIAFAGIGRPEKFFATLRQLGAELVGARSFGDHHIYTRSELESLRQEALERKAGLMTTEKDLVRIPEEQRAEIGALPVRAEFDDPILVSTLLDRVAPLAGVNFGGAL